MTRPAEDLRRRISSDVITTNGSASTKGPTPDPLVAELLPEVAALRAAYDETVDAARPLGEDLQAALDARAEHLNSPDAVFSYADGSLTFSDPEGVRLSNEVRRIEAALAANGARSKRALVDYLVASFQAAHSLRDVALARMADAQRRAEEAAKALQDALADRDRYWHSAGQPVGAAHETVAPAVKARFLNDSRQTRTDLAALLPKALSVPRLLTPILAEAGQQ